MDTTPIVVKDPWKKLSFMTVYIALNILSPSMNIQKKSSDWWAPIDEEVNKG